MIWKLHIGIPAQLGSARLAHSWRHPVIAEDPMMVGAATVFVVTDIAKSTERHRDVLGFTVTFEYGTPAFYVCVCRDEVALHLLSASQTSGLSGNGGICVFVRDVDAVYAELAARGARIVKPPRNYDYSMRDFDLIDLMEISLHSEWGPRPDHGDWHYFGRPGFYGGRYIGGSLMDADADRADLELRRIKLLVKDRARVHPFAGKTSDSRLDIFPLCSQA
jgi:catechol 2,3-dioxygenase-like lactoylglutathione lyase family enzyme